MPVGRALPGLLGIMLCLLLLAIGPASAENFSRVDLQPTVVNDQQTVNSKDIAAHQYKGNLRLFVAQPVSRFRNDLGEPHLHGVLGIPLDIQITLNFPDTLRGDITYNDTGMYANNIEVIGAVYEFAVHTNYSHPPSGNPFNAHWVDAATVGIPGLPGVDEATLPYTHTVLVEYVTRYS
ncbi:MAG: hypothetical protein E4G91_03035 [Candidatus Zixiibacteriota bacterium]|nr:MAG: hypothetical protein E4G91_03035 [candidate division Zixibacteria bacterium]